MQFRRLIGFFVVATTLWVSSFAAAQGRPAVVATSVSFEWPSAAIDLLKKTHSAQSSSFVLQQELDCLIAPDGGGGCASAAAVDALQVLRVMDGLEPLPNPHQAALAAFRRQPELLAGRVSNGRLVRLLEGFGTQLAGGKLSVRVHSALNSAYSEEKGSWSLTEGPELKVAPRLSLGALNQPPGGASKPAS